MADPEQLLPRSRTSTWAGVEEKLGIGSAAAALAVSMMGTGIVAFPYAFALCGAGVGPVVLIFCGLLAHMSYVRLIRCTINERVTSYNDLLRRLPTAWGHYTNISLWALLVLATAAYVLISAHIIRSVSLHGAEDVPAVLGNSILFALILLVIFPLCLLKSLRGLSLISTYCTFAIIAVVGLIVWQCLQILLEAPATERVLPTADTKLGSVVLAMPIFGCAMFGHMNIAQIYAELTPAAKKRAELVSAGACAGTVALYMVVGGVGYAAFGGAAQADVVAQIAARCGETRVVAIMQGLLASFIVLKTPLLILPLRKLTVAILSPASDPNDLPTSRHVCLTVLPLFFVYLAAIAIPDLDRLLELLGALIVVPLCFVVPARIAWTVEVPRPAAKCSVLAVFGLITSVLSLMAVFSK